MKTRILLMLALSFAALSCGEDKDNNVKPDEDLSSMPYDPEGYDLVIPTGFPQLIIPADNPMTQEGVQLGRMLFYDPILSVDSTISCSSCHQLESAFSDNLTYSLGVFNQESKRNSMSLINVGFYENGLFWDGRVKTLEEQALHPVANPVEMGEVWENVEEKLQRHSTYPSHFRKAFGIERRSEITRDLVAKALAQFQRTLISADSRFDKKFYQNDADPFLLSDLEIDGYAIFFDDQSSTAKGGHCAHCHDGGPLLSSNQYFNNAIQNVSSLDDFPDKGLGGVTGKRTDNGKFRATSLRNIELTAPYMHNGRFATLEEVVDHYNSGGHWVENVNSQSINKLNLSDYEKKALVAFLKTFTDTTYYNNEAFKNPFK
jgi:cytochrome c peroxidase